MTVTYKYYKNIKAITGNLIDTIKSLPCPPLFESSHRCENFSIPVTAPLANGSLCGGRVHIIIPMRT